ncbi:MAG: hypothetical protein AAF965_00080 [Pseudomonadota bacterium]
MVLSDDEIQYRLLEVIDKKGPIGWYSLEIILPVAPESYPRGKSMRYFRALMVEKGLVKGSADTQYEITDLGQDFLRRGAREAEA